MADESSTGLSAQDCVPAQPEEPAARANDEPTEQPAEAAAAEEEQPGGNADVADGEAEPAAGEQPAAGASREAEEAALKTAQDAEYGTVPLTPPEDCEPVTSDGGVLKKVLEPGFGDPPPLHANCLVHYVGWLVPSGQVFMDSRKDSETSQPKAITAGRSSAAQETGLCLAAATMRKGEKALVYIQDPVYGYGERGSFSFPAVPPSSQLVYRVEVISWEAIEESDANRGSLLYEERLERAERRRLAGNVLFQEGRYKEALGKYAMALSYLDEDFMFQLDGAYLAKAEAIKTPIHLNMAAAQLKTQDYNTAIYNCSQVLNTEPGNVKALFRRARAHHSLGRTAEALQDLEAASKGDPTDKGIQAEMHAVRASIKKEREAQAKMFKGRLPKAPPAPPAPPPPPRPSQPEIEPAAVQPQPAGGRQAAQAEAGTPAGMLLAILAWLWGLLASLLGFGKQRLSQPSTM